MEPDAGGWRVSLRPHILPLVPGLGPGRRGGGLVPSPDIRTPGRSPGSAVLNTQIIDVIAVPGLDPGIDPAIQAARTNFGMVARFRGAK